MQALLDVVDVIKKVLESIKQFIDTIIAAVKGDDETEG